MPNSKQIVYLSQAQYAELIANGSITVNGITVNYDENDIYVTPQAEPVTDVRVAGTSVAANGVADIPIATSSTAGAFKTNDPTFYITNGNIRIDRPSDNYIINGTDTTRIPTIAQQHKVVFYGLAKAAGDNTQRTTDVNTFTGTYTPEAKGAIQKMLGVSDLIATEENNLIASKAYKVGDIFTANGKLYKATAAIAVDGAIITDGANANCEETSVGEGFVKFTDYATNTTPGVVKINTGLGIGIMSDSKALTINAAQESQIKTATNSFNPITVNRQHQAVFYGLAKVAGSDEKDSELPLGTYSAAAKAAIQTMLGVPGDVQVNGTSIVSDGVANIPWASSSSYGVVKINSNYGLDLFTAGTGDRLIHVKASTSAKVKGGTEYYQPIVPYFQHEAVFYGLAKAAGDTTQSVSSNAVGVYTDSAKASIKAMLGIQDGSTGTVDVTGTTPTITAVENTRYVCGEVTSLSFTPPASGISIVRFTSGSTVTVLTIPSTVKFPEWFDPTSLETNTIYEICVTDGEFGAVMSWAL